MNLELVTEWYYVECPHCMDWSVVGAEITVHECETCSDPRSGEVMPLLRPATGCEVMAAERTRRLKMIPWMHGRTERRRAA
ncbi:MAG: hypothetical protein PVF40_11270 [Ectothiorhodospiraceae bacterium]|jgi:hypothetical protein